MKRDCYRLHFSSPVIGVGYTAVTDIIAGSTTHSCQSSWAHQMRFYLFILEYLSLT